MIPIFIDGAVKLTVINHGADFGREHLVSVKIHRGGKPKDRKIEVYDVRVPHDRKMLAMKIAAGLKYVEPKSKTAPLGGAVERFIKNIFFN